MVFLFAFTPMAMADSESSREPEAAVIENIVVWTDDGVETIVPVDVPSDSYLQQSVPEYTPPNLLAEAEEYGDDPMDYIPLPGDQYQNNATVSPYTRVGFLESTFDANDDGRVDMISRATASLQGPDLLISAAHCVYDSDFGGWSEVTKYYPLRNGATLPANYATVAYKAISQTYINGDKKDDWTIIRLNKPV